jgi:hypothetical protein
MKMNKKIICAPILLLIASLAVIPAFTSAATNTLIKSDFMQESFQKTVDFFDYARAYATLQGISTPDNFDDWHANMYMTYVNTSGIQLLYTGLENITIDGSDYLRIPAQSTLMHYKANGTSEDVLAASTFLMLMAFNDSSSSLFEGSPDVGDNLFASYSLGFDFSSIGATMPALNSKTETIPLVRSSDGLQWSWGMKYTNLTALWWKTWIEPTNPHFDSSLPFAITTYDELTFSYTLTIEPTNNKAVLTENHVIGRMRDMLIGSGLLWFHLNNTGTYGLMGGHISDQTIYGFLQENNIKMSIVDYQTIVLANQNTFNTILDGQKLSSDQLVSKSAVNTYGEDGNKVGSLDFTAKSTYNLYNYTQDSTETTPQTYNAITRTTIPPGFAGNTGLFKTQINLMKFLPLLVLHMYPTIYQKARESISDMSKANYFYLTSYPTYSGYRIEHDPVFTAYAVTSSVSGDSSTSTATTNPNQTNPLRTGLIFAIIAAIVAVIAMVAVLLRRKTFPPPPLP